MKIGIGRYREVARGKILGDEHGMLKLIFHQKTGRLLGVHVIGENASETAPYRSGGHVFQWLD